MTTDLYEAIAQAADGARQLGVLAESSRRRVGELEAELESARQELGRLRAGVEEPDRVVYLLWSGKHQAWWRPDARGYTSTEDEAGRYTRAEAVGHVVASAQCGVREQVTTMVAAPDNWRGLPSRVPVVFDVDPGVQVEQEPRPECPSSKRVDGPLHSWKFDGDDPRIECVFCGEMRDVISGAVVLDGNHG